MKIQVFSTHPLYDNRIKRHISTLTKYGYKTTYINSSQLFDSANDKFENVKLIHITESFEKNNIKGVIKAYKVMLKQIKEGQASIVHVHDPLLIPLLYYSKLKHKITIFDKHESYEKGKGLNAHIGSLFEKLFVKYIDGVVYVNEAQLDYIGKLGYKHMKMIPNYQSIESFKEVSQNPINMISHNHYIKIIYVGTLSEISRNTLLMLDVMDDVLSSNSNVKFILGGNISEDEVRKKVELMKSNHSNFEYRGVMRHSEVIAETLNSDIGLYFAKDTDNNFRSSPNKVYEYMLAGIALVGMGNFMHYKEIDNNAGKVFEYSASKYKIIDFVQSLINNAEKLNEFKINAKKLGIKYSWESVEDRYIDLYEEIAKIL